MLTTSQPRRADDARRASTRSCSRGVAHLIFPDEVQTLAAPPTGAVRARGPAARPADRAAAGAAAGGARAARAGQAARDHRRPRRALRHGARHRAGRAARRARDHDVQGQGPDRRRPPAGGRRARAQRHAGGELVHERVRPAARARRLVLQPHRHLPRQADHPGRLRPARSSASSTRSTVPVWGEIGSRRRACSGAAAEPARERADQRAELAARWAIWRAEKAAAPRDDRGRGVNSAAVFDALCAPCPRGRRRSLWTSATTPTRSGATSSASPGQRVLMSGYLGSIGFGYPAAIGAWAAAPTGRSSRSPATAGSPSTWPSCPPPSSTACRSRTCCSTTASSARSPRNSGPATGTSGRPRCTIRTSPVRRDLRRPGHPRRPPRRELDDALAAALAHDGPALVEVIADPDSSTPPRRGDRRTGGRRLDVLGSSVAAARSGFGGYSRRYVDGLGRPRGMPLAERQEEGGRASAPLQEGVAYECKLSIGEKRITTVITPSPGTGAVGLRAASEPGLPLRTARSALSRDGETWLDPGVSLRRCLGELILWVSCRRRTLRRRGRSIATCSACGV